MNVKQRIEALAREVARLAVMKPAQKREAVDYAKLARDVDDFVKSTARPHPDTPRAQAREHVAAFIAAAASFSGAHAKSAALEAETDQLTDYVMADEAREDSR